VVSPGPFTWVPSSLPAWLRASPPDAILHALPASLQPDVPPVSEPNAFPVWLQYATPRASPAWALQRGSLPLVQNAFPPSARYGFPVLAPDATRPASPPSAQSALQELPFSPPEARASSGVPAFSPESDEIQAWAHCEIPASPQDALRDAIPVLHESPAAQSNATPEPAWLQVALPGYGFPDEPRSAKPESVSQAQASRQAVPPVHAFRAGLPFAPQVRVLPAVLPEFLPQAAPRARVLPFSLPQ
jgi:hypothetical protein